MRHLMAKLVVMGALVGWSGVVRADEGMLTQDEIKKLVDAGQYKDALKGMSRVLALKGQAAVGYDRFELLMMKAECQLQVKDSTGALATLTEAKKEAFGQRNFDKLAEPTALTYLIQKSSG